MARMTEVDMPVDTGDFRLLDRRLSTLRRPRTQPLCARDRELARLQTVRV